MMERNICVSKNFSLSFLKCLLNVDSFERASMAAPTHQRHILARGCFEAKGLVKKISTYWSTRLLEGDQTQAWK